MTRPRPATQTKSGRIESLARDLAEAADAEFRRTHRDTIREVAVATWGTYKAARHHADEEYARRANAGGA